jgi:hypothetical protein
MNKAVTIRTDMVVLQRPFETVGIEWQTQLTTPACRAGSTVLPHFQARLCQQVAVRS